MNDTLLLLFTLFLATTVVAQDQPPVVTNACSSEVRFSYPMSEIYHGVAYYPELWPETNIDGDIATMKKLGINVVRMGEFAWAKMEPADGQISADFFLKVMDKLHAAGIGTIFCTPTVTPPIWLTYGHPERCVYNQAGQVMAHGSRQHACYDNPEVRAACTRMVTALAEAIGHHPGLVAWQIDNEMRSQVADDYNPSTIKCWHAWLAKRYGTIDRLNDAWGTQIWSEKYDTFEQVPPPVLTPFAHNASLSTAWLTFSREDISEFMEEQEDIIRRYSSAPITHNLNLGFSLNFERVCKGLDFAALDNYSPADDWSEMIFYYDFFRGAKLGQPFYIMETSPSHNGWLHDYTVPHPPGYLAAEAVAAYGSGAQGFSYWLWRQQRTGCEITHGAILNAWGSPDLGYSSVSEVNQARCQLEQILEKSHPLDADAAVTWSDRGRAFFEVEPLGENHATGPLDYEKIISNWHRLLLNLGIWRDVRFEGNSITGLKLLITPAMPYVSEDFLKRIDQWVKDGGIWIAGPLTGTRTAEHTVPTDAGLGGLEAFGGVETVYSFPVTGSGTKGKAFGLTAPLTGWCYALRTNDPQTASVGTIKSKLVPELSFITERQLGKGLVVMLSAQPEGDDGEKLLARLVEHYAAKAGINGKYEVTDGTIVYPRETFDGHRLWLVVNMDGKGGRLVLPPGASDALNGKSLKSGVLKIKPYSYLAIEW